MSTSAAVRASSLLVSAGLLSGLVVVALTFTYVLPAVRSVESPIIETLPWEEPPPPEPVRAQPNPPPVTPTESTVPADFPLIPPDTPVVNTEPFVPISTGPVVPTITDPHWLRRPRDLQRYYPRRALDAGVEGFVVLDCRVAVTGTLGCTVVSETPPNWGFAQAALRIAGDHRMEPAMRDGAPVEGRYRMRVPFRAE